MPPPPPQLHLGSFGAPPLIFICEVETTPRSGKGRNQTQIRRRPRLAWLASDLGVASDSVPGSGVRFRFTYSNRSGVPRTFRSAWVAASVPPSERIRSTLFHLRGQDQGHAPHGPSVSHCLLEPQICIQPRLEACHLDRVFARKCGPQNSEPGKLAKQPAWHSNQL